MGKLVTIATKARFDALREASNISETSLNFILETGLLYTHNIFINGASFGTATSNYIPVKIGGVTKNLSLNGHTHSNYYDNSSDIDIGSNKIKSGTLELLKYSSDTLILGNSSIPTEFFGTLKTTKDGTKYTILDTNNFSIVNKTSTNLTLNNVALFKYGSSSFQLDYVRRYNTVETFNNLAKYTSAGTTNENSKAYGFITLSTDTGTNTYSYAQIRVSIPDNTLEFRTNSDTTWKGTLLGGVYRNITINGTTYSIVTKAGSLPTIIAPTALGTSGQYLTTSDDGKSLTWRTLPTDNNTWRPIAVNGTEKRSSSTSSGNLDIINGTNTTVEWTSGNKLKINAVDTWTAFVGASDSVAGTAGYVSAPGKGNQGKFFRGDGTWATPTNTWNAANTSQAGYVPQLTTGGGTISTQASEYVLTYVSSGSGTVAPTWKLLPVNAFKNDNTWTAWKGATDSANGTAGYMPAPTSAQRGQFLRGDGSWVSLNNYSLPTASSGTLGGVKTGAAITDTTGYTAVAIKDGVIYYKDTNTTYSFSNLLFLLTSGTNLMTYNSQATRTVLAGSNITFTHSNNILTIAAKDTTYSTVSKSASGLCPALPNETTTTKYLRLDGTWVTPPNDNTWKAANASQEGYVPKSTANKILRANGDGTLYWGDDANTTYTFYNLLFQNSGGTTVDTYKPTTSPTKTLKAGANVTISAASNVITIASTNTWNANAVGVAGYVAAPTKAANANMTWLTNAEGVPAWRASNNHSHSYLPLSGGSVTGLIKLRQQASNTLAWIEVYSNDWNTRYGWLGTSWETGTLLWNGNTVYHSGNLPAYPTKSSWNYDDRYVSSLTTNGNSLRWVKNGSNNDITIPYATNADTVDGYHASTFYLRDDTALGNINNKVTKIDVYADPTLDIKDNGLGGNGFGIIQCLLNNTQYNGQLLFNYTHPRILWRNRNGSQNWSAWQGIISGSADKLTTSRTIWGQSFDGSANVNGTITLNCADWDNDYGIHINEGGSTSYGFDILYGSGDKFKISTRSGSTAATEVLTILRGSTVVDFKGTPTVNGTSVSLSGHTHSYLPLSGGTMSNTNLVTNLNADYLDGYHESSFLRYRGTTSNSGEATLWSQLGLKQYNGALPESLSGAYNWGQVVSFATQNARFEIYASHQSSNPSNATNGLYYRTGWDADKRLWTRFLDSNNSSVSKSGETLTVKINGTSQSLTNSTYTLAGLMGSSAKGSTTLPIYWTGSAFANTSYTLGKSVPSDAVFTDHTYNFGGTTFYSGNSGNAEHNCNNAVKNGHYYYSSNGPATSIGASTSDGALYVQSYSDSWVGQIAQDYRNGRLFVRGKKDGTWQSWIRVAHYNEIPTNNNQLTNGAGYVTSSGVTSVATGTGLTGGTITGTGTISINSTYQTYISHGESAYNSLGNYYPVLNGAGKWSASGGGNNAYCLIAEINTNAGYINYPITFEIGGRGTIISRVTIRFNNQSAADPDCNLFATDEATCFYLYKAAANTWRLYASSPSDSVWGSWYVYRVFGNIAGRVTMKMETVSSLPSGYKSVTYTGNVAYASSAGSVAWSNVSSRPTKLSQFTNDSGFVTSSGVTSITLKAGTGISLDVNNTAITTSGTRTISIKTPSSGAWFSGTAYVGSDGVMEIGRYIDFHPTSASTLDYNIRLDAGTGTTARVFTFPDSAGTLLSSGNSSVSKSGSTLTVKINGTTQSLTNTDTTYSANNGVGLSGTTFYNSGVRATTINGNYLRVNTNGTNADLTIPYATSAGSTKKLASYYDSRPSTANLLLGDGSLRFFEATTSMTEGKPTIGDSSIIHLSWDNNGGWEKQIAVGHGSAPQMMIRTQNNGTWGSWINILDSNNSSVSKSGSTLTVKINGTSQSITDTNTWRGIQDNLTSSTNTTESLSAKQGYLLANGSARDNTKLPLAGGTMTGAITLNNAVYINTKTTGGTSVNTLGMNDKNSLVIGYGIATNSLSTFIEGLNVYIATGSSPSTKMTVASGGNVGIGTTSPEYKLDVSGSIKASESFYVAAGQRIQQAGGTGDFYIGNSGNMGWVRFQDICSMTDTGEKYWSIRTDGRMYAKQHINIGYGLGHQTTNRAEASIISITDLPCDLMLGSNSVKKWSITCRASNESYQLGFWNYTSAAYAAYINGTNFTCAGNMYASNFYTTSDKTKKQNISSFSEHIRKFQLKDTEKWHYGVIAQEVPEMFRDGEEGNMTVNYNSVLSYYVGLLENKVASLEKELSILKQKLK